MKKASPLAAPADALERNLPVLKADQAGIDKVRFPDLTDLMARLHFSTSDGRIWLDDQRMLLIHAKALGSLRREMIEAFGAEVTRGLFTRMGYQAGTFDAQMARKVRPQNTLKDMFVVGPQMHCLEGIGLSEPVRLEFDVEHGKHYGEFIWTHQVEDEEHARHFPIGTEPSCWMQVGYASGFSTEFMGRQILYREVECQSMGQPACRIVGKPVEAWGEDATHDLQYLMPAALQSEAGELTGSAARHAVLPPLDSAETGRPVGISPGFNSVLHMVRRVAPTNATVLFLGESGVGKEVFARMLHRLSSRNQKPFVAVNCASIPEQLIESELFGAERGAYTGAMQSRAGRFERADGGTLFLDEIGTLSAGAQGNLLRALQEGEIERLGDTHTRRVDVRVIAATNVDLRKEVAAGRFREDLFFRLNVFPVRVTPLRERREDIPLLMTHFLGKFNRLHGHRLTGFTQRAVDAVMSYDWPGNIRELENVIERGVILAAENSVIDSPQLFTSGEQFNDKQFDVDRAGMLVKTDRTHMLTDPVSDPDVERVSKRFNSLLLGVDDDQSKVSLDDIETLLLRKALDRAHGNVAAAARLLGITRPQMVYRLKSRGITHQGD
ncbi:sigma 54-interacting transcriptional regulator [Variovorax sp. J22R24]|uniref:sigma-54-dependent Fis family transcriptional regulator n=1 Tax=Variovorax gracilis TaxID=3053502 RepID=UPI002576CBEF|nr:sigma-54-dependent Fis family transcriptional regulator [Variovorax sp. J22R24]MDM0110392.1 sigma 54-interacting transcriptional regulator [Variovorax sp. J22R24]